MFCMNYQKIYASIVLRAQAEYSIRSEQKSNGEYFESHHIIPKSLNGSDRLYNRALLTAREHFICHWLLVKIYPNGSVEHGKMLYAFWRMQSSNNCHNRYIFSRAYEKLRKDFASYVGENTAITQSGERNSHYGTKWYTNYETGLSKPFKIKPDGKWVEGRCVYNGKTSSIMYLLTGVNNGRPPKYLHKKSRSNGKMLLNKNKSIEKARRMWNEFHNGGFTSLNEYAKTLNISSNATRMWFIRYIPKFSNIEINNVFASDKQLVGIYI